jgi:glycosyltransferase involved in cell wall biosynthesis
VEIVCLDQADMLADSSRVRSAARAIWNRAAARRLLVLIESTAHERPIVHIHGWSKALSPSVLWACRRSGAPTVQTLHDYVAICPNGALYNFRKQENCPLHPLSAACVVSDCDSRHYAFKAWRVARHATLRATGGSRSPSHFIYLCERQRTIVEPLLPPGAVLHKVENPIDVDDRGPAAAPQDAPFLFVGRLSTEKGPALFAEAAHSAGAAACFVGDGPLRAELERHARGARFTGWLDAAGVRAHMRAARALVFPSLWYETFGLSVHEAMSHGVPVIVSDNTVSAAAVEHGTTGLLFRSGDAADLATQLRTLADAATARRMGQAAYERYWRTPLTTARHVDELERVYRTVSASQ